MRQNYLTANITKLKLPPNGSVSQQKETVNLHVLPELVRWPQDSETQYVFLNLWYCICIWMLLRNWISSLRLQSWTVALVHRGCRYFIMYQLSLLLNMYTNIKSNSFSDTFHHRITFHVIKGHIRWIVSMNNAGI